MKRNALVFVVLSVVIIAMVAFGKYVDRTRNHGQSQLIGDAKGKQAPEFNLASLDGQRIKLSDYRGKAVVLNFWATWCPPCKVEMPWFEDFQKQYGKDGLVVLGIAMDDSDAAKIAEFTHQMGVNYQVLLGTDEVSDLYGNVQYLPTTFYIDRNGVIVDKAAGLFSRKDIEDQVKRVLGSPSSTRAAEVIAPSAPKSTEASKQKAIVQ